ncbi:MAG: hypothetical protein JSW39_02845 [Desulfobacterales bacterium]|nr:MAG: hypothetical protein JSW39_02845 [Desulfobacterales bacterium]
MRYKKGGSSVEREPPFLLQAGKINLFRLQFPQTIKLQRRDKGQHNDQPTEL